MIFYNIYKNVMLSITKFFAFRSVLLNEFKDPLPNLSLYPYLILPVYISLGLSPYEYDLKDLVGPYSGTAASDDRVKSCSPSLKFLIGLMPIVLCMAVYIFAGNCSRLGFRRLEAKPIRRVSAVGTGWRVWGLRAAWR